MSNNNLKSYNKYYWISWIIYMLLFYVIKFLKFPYLENFEAPYYYAIYWIFVMVVNLYEGSRLTSYLKIFHSEKWNELTHSSLFGTLKSNSFRLLPFLLLSDHLDDDQLQLLKGNHKRFLLFMIIVFIGFPIFSILAFIQGY